MNGCNLCFYSLTEARSASQPASNPKAIARTICYLQELHKLGLVIRQKVIASQRPKLERGRTYEYQSKVQAQDLRRGER